jgi:caffeoyl-CoA O-methyltransferase
MTRETYIRSLYVGEDEQYRHVQQSIEANNMPSISVSVESGRLLTLLVQMRGAKNILEIGALGGYSGLCMLKGSAPETRLTSLEISEKHARVAQSNLSAFGYGEQVTYKVGDASETLADLVRQKQQFDFFFIDADKASYEHYLEQCIRLASPGAVITADNTLQRDKVWQNPEADPDTRAMVKFNEQMARHPRLTSLLVPLGDGLSVATVQSPS